MTNATKKTNEAEETSEKTKVTKKAAVETPKKGKSEDISFQVTKVEDTELETIKPAEIHDGQLILTDKHKALIKSQIAKNATKEELDLFFMMAYRTRLDPLLKQLHFIKYGNNVNYVTSIDGYRIIAHRTGDFAGVDLPVYEYDKNGNLTHCSIKVYKFVHDEVCSFSAKVKFSEYNTNKNNWASMPETMIAKVSEAHALRKAFPQDLSGIYTTDEMDQAENSRTVAKSPEKKKLAPVMISKVQAQRIGTLVEEKEVNIDWLKDLVKTGYKRESITKLTTNQADHLIKKLSDLPNPLKEEIEEMPEESSFVEFVEGEMANAEPLPDDVNFNEIDEAIKGV